MVSNHLSYLDPPLIIATIISRYPEEIVRAPAKAELFSLPLLDRFLASFGAFPVLRHGRGLRVMRRMVLLLKHQKMVLFPEGGRSFSGELEAGMRAVGGIVLDAQPTIIPACVVGTDRVLSPRMKIPRLFQRLEIRFGPPLDWRQYEHLPRKEAARRITDAIMDAIGKLQDRPTPRTGQTGQAAPNRHGELERKGPQGVPGRPERV